MKEMKKVEDFAYAALPNPFKTKNCVESTFELLGQSTQQLIL